ncbi:MAG: SCO family protein [Alphaproteobacteria bacterium]|nr:SCO family protein [Alphaproteobacteria bacterium]
MKKIVLAWVVCVLGLVVLFAWLGNGWMPRTSTHDDTGTGKALLAAEFTLQDAGGTTVTGATYRGRYLLVYFGFTHCPDICPTTLLLMGNALKQLGDKAARIQPLFITVDPERDTPKVVGDYVAHFGKDFVGLTGSPAQIKAAADNFKVFYSAVADEKNGGAGTVDHSGFIYLMGPDGQYLSHFAASVSEQELVGGLRHALR